MSAIWQIVAVGFAAFAFFDGGLSATFVVFALYMAVYYLDDIASSLRKLTRELEGADKGKS